MFLLGTAGLILKWIVSLPFDLPLGDYFRFADNPTGILPVITERPASAHSRLLVRWDLTETFKDRRPFYP